MKKKEAVRRALRPEEEAKTFGAGLNFAASEAYRLLRTNVLFGLPFSALKNGQTCRIIGITSSLSGEGKSTTALNLAYVLAESGRKILLIEADMRLPTITKRLGLEHQKAGLSYLLVGMCDEQEACRLSGIQENLWVMSAGDTPPNPSELLGSDRMRDSIKELGKTFDFIILDLPPVNEVTDALVTSRLVHGMIMVVRKDYATRSSVGEAMMQLRHANAKLLGIVLTHADEKEKKYKKGSYAYSDAAKKESKT